MATEKQINFINKLIERKGQTAFMRIAGHIEAVSRFNGIEELTSGQASYVIGMLLEEPDFNEVAYRAAQQRGLNRYEQLVTWCKENGVKGVRSRMKTANIMKLIAAAGLTAPAELVKA
jgi:hypothetical protein